MSVNITDALADNSYKFRKEWVVGNKCLIHSKSRNQWIEGKIVEIYNENDREWLSVEYMNRIKDVLRFDTKVIAPFANTHSNRLKNYKVSDIETSLCVSVKEESTQERKICETKNNGHVKQETCEIPINVKQEPTEDRSKRNNNIKNEQTTAIIQNDRHHYSGPNECIVYWDYYKHPISTHNFTNIILSLKQHICNKIGSIPIQFRIYYVSRNLKGKLQDELDINGIEQISVTHHTSITSRLLIDLTLKLHESEKHKISKCIGVISRDKDIAHLLSRIHKEPTISNSFIISFESNTNTNYTIHPSSNHVDFVLVIDVKNYLPVEDDDSQIMPKPFSQMEGFRMINNIGCAYGVPIYNSYYYDCAEFKIGKAFNMNNFGALCLDFAVRLDLKLTRDLRQIRNGKRRYRKRQYIKFNGGQTGFYNSVPDIYYRELFGECFARGNKYKTLKLNINLKNYCSKQKLIKKKNKKFIMHEKGCYIRKDMKYRLYLLMRLAAKHVTFGVVQQPPVHPPWRKTTECITDELYSEDDVIMKPNSIKENYNGYIGIKPEPTDKINKSINNECDKNIETIVFEKQDIDILNENMNE